MNRIVLIIPYFGKLPNTFSIWLQSAKNNPDVDFLFFTDSDQLKSEGNIKKVDITLSKLKKNFETKFGCNISLEFPYKLCDYKAMYGYLFQEYIQQYEFWGHCDIDLVFGNIRRFVTDEMLNRFDKIYELGHFTLYRNSVENNQIFMQDGEYPEYNYKEVISSPESFYFDEHFGMRLKSRRLKIKTYYGVGDFFDVNANCLDFQEAIAPHRNVAYFVRENDSLFMVDYSGNVQEIMYVHLQKRRMEVLRGNNNDVIYIIPNKFVAAIDNNKNVFPGDIDKKKYRLMLKIRHFKDFFKRYRLVKKDYGSIYRYYRSRQDFKVRRKCAMEKLEKIREAL